MELTFDSGVKEYTIRGVNGIVTDIADTLFGSVNAYSAANGAPIWQNFMTAIIEQFDEAVKREQALADEKIRKYTQKYRK